MDANLSSTSQTVDGWQSRFLELLPKLKQLASLAFRACDAELREELICEVIGYCYCEYLGLVRRGREHDAHPTVLVRFGVKRAGTGVRIGCARNRYDVTSRYSQLKSGLRVEAIDRHDNEGAWQQIILESRSASPADVAATRVDFADWIATLSQRDRQIAMQLAIGEQTSEVAERFQLSRGRISQLRRELARSWYRLHGLDAEGHEIEPAAA